jgi:hypothetical protein
MKLRLRCQARAMPADDATPRRMMTVAEVAEYLKVQSIEWLGKVKFRPSRLATTGILIKMQSKSG